ncbi:hypothetical protein FPQ18DRAFT_335973 [Pyronema domesticum]|nr:hypothetical protein FPQ18DRAFT_335973 [Pyronema domesticum]
MYDTGDKIAFRDPEAPYSQTSYVVYHNHRLPSSTLFVPAPPPITMPTPTTFTQHIFKNISLIALSILFLPLDAFITATCLLWNFSQRFSDPPPAAPRNEPRRTVVVSSLCMAKGLLIARSFHLAGHKVIGVDFDTAHYAHSPVISSGAFSAALARYYRVATPRTDESRAKYATDMVDIIKKEGADLWICVSGVASTTEDALIKATVERETKCKVFQPDPETCDQLHEKHEFIRLVKEAGLRTPLTTLVTSREEVYEVLQQHPSTQFIVKCVELDDVSRSDMTQIPQPTPEKTEKFINSLDISPNKRWVVQEFIHGDEYCCHAVIVRGIVHAFVACPSSEMLMHYKPLPADCSLSRAMLAFVRKLVKTLEGGQLTGQLSFDFLIDPMEAKKKPESVKLFPIECNPRTHTAVILFKDQPQQLANAHLKLLEKDDHAPKDGKIAGVPAKETDIIGVAAPHVDRFTKKDYYWIGHDLVTDVAIPVSDFLMMKIGVYECLRQVSWYAVKVLTWKDATFEFWDPLPWFWLYHVYYPWMFVTSLLTGKRWSRVNTSTTRVFESY